MVRDDPALLLFLKWNTLKCSLSLTLLQTYKTNTMNKKTFKIHFRVIFTDGTQKTGVNEVKGRLFILSAWQEQQRIRKMYSEHKGVNVLVNLN